MSEINVKVSRNVDKVIDLEKQITFGLANALNETARQAQQAVIEDIQQTFTTRNPWYLPRNKFGIRTEHATKTNLHTAVKTEAYWLTLHEQGGEKTPQAAQQLTIPTPNVRRSKRDNILKSNLPRNLKNAFVLNFPSGPALFIRRARQGLVRLYNLESSVTIKKDSTVIEPTVKTFRERFGRIFAEKIQEAFRTAK